MKLLIVTIVEIYTLTVDICVSESKCFNALYDYYILQRIWLQIYCWISCCRFTDLKYSYIQSLYREWDHNHTCPWWLWHHQNSQKHLINFLLTFSCHNKCV